MNETMHCDLCKKPADTLFLITVIAVGDKELCPQCYLKMLPHPDRTVKQWRVA